MVRLADGVVLRPLNRPPDRGEGAPERGHAIVSAAGRRWRLAPDDTLTFGRGADRQLRLGHEPSEDDFVSRHAGTLVVLVDGVLVRNDSTTQSLVLQAIPGPELSVAPRMAVATMPYRRVRVVVPGRHGWRYTFTIDTHGLTDAPDTPPDDTLDGRVPTRGGAGKITARERRMLAALCEPLLTQAGSAAVPATYRQVAERVGTTAQTARNCLDLLRARLSDQDGIPGLRADEDDEPRAGADFRAALAQWALRSGTVTAGSLDLLTRDPTGDRAADG